MFVIGHYNSAGNIWRYKLDCTRRQAVIFAGVLRWLRNVGIKEANKRGTGNHSHRQPDSAAGITKFCATLEQDILTALYAKYPATESDYNHHEFIIL